MDDKIKKLTEIATKFLGFGKAPEAVVYSRPEGFDTAKIKGSQTTVDYNPTLEVGTPVMVASGTGSDPASDGTIELENGVSFIVKDGKIESVLSEAAAEDPKEDPKGAADTVTREEFDALLARVTALEDSEKADFSKIPTTVQLEQFTTGLQNVGQVITELAKIPVNVPLAIDADALQNQAVDFEAVASHFSKVASES